MWGYKKGDYTSLNVTDGESNGSPFQYSCLEIPMDGGEPGRLQSMRS